MEYVVGWNHEAFCADRMSCCRQLGLQTDFSQIEVIYRGEAAILVIARVSIYSICL
jgi:hypothetical protein